MRNEIKFAILIYIFVSVIAIVTLSIVLATKQYECSNKVDRENFKKCICSQNQAGRSQNCQNLQTVNNLYVDGQLTEFTSLPNKGWSQVSSGDYNFPESQGCSNTNYKRQDTGKWSSWDFTDFGN